MLPIRCIQPPWRNIDVIIERNDGINLRVGDNSENPNSTAGIIPKLRKILSLI